MFAVILSGPMPMVVPVAPVPAAHGAAHPGRRRHARNCADKFKKTIVCRYSPMCHKGPSCPFAHCAEELRIRPNLTKSRMCAGYYDGRCKLPSHECGFAHGEHELRTPQVAIEASADMEAIRDFTQQVSSAGLGASPTASTVSGSSTPTNALGDAGSEQGDASPAVTPMPSTSTDGGSSRSNSFSINGKDEPGAVEPIVSKWLQDIRSISKSGSDQDLADALPTPEECRLALLSAMPEVYED